MDIKRGIEADLTYYNTHQDRVRFITSRLEMDVPILDIGCGEFIYYKKLMGKGFKQRYYAVDTDPNFERLAEVMQLRYDAGNLFFHTSLDEFEGKERVNILMTEVIEHNPMDDAKALVKQALMYNFNSIIITTPNSEFNSFYADHDMMRHDDHHFELTQAEFKAMMDECVAGNANVRLEYAQIGDRLNGLQPTQACIIYNNN